MDFCRRRESDQTYMDKLFIPVQGCLLEVVREQYTDFYRDKERWRYLKKLDNATSFLALDRGLGPVCPVSFCFFVFYPEALSEPANKKTVYHNRQTASLLSVSRLDYVRSGHVLRREPRCLFLHT